MAEELHFDNPAAAAQDPSTDAEALRQLAYRYPELRPAVAAHPHAYRGLLDWLHQFNDPAVNAALEVFLVKCFFNLRSSISVNTTTHVDKCSVLLQVSKIV